MPTTTITPRNPEDPESLTFIIATTDDNGNVSRTWIDLHELVAAVDYMGDILGDGMTAGDAGSHFTCNEAESIADVLRAGGRTDAADGWLNGHATGDDDPEDRHHDAYLENHS